MLLLPVVLSVINHDSFETFHNLKYEISRTEKTIAVNDKLPLTCNDYHLVSVNCGMSNCGQIQDTSVSLAMTSELNLKPVAKRIWNIVYEVIIDQHVYFDWSGLTVPLVDMTTDCVIVKPNMKKPRMIKAHALPANSFCLLVQKPVSFT